MEYPLELQEVFDAQNFNGFKLRIKHYRKGIDLLYYDKNVYVIEYSRRGLLWKPITEFKLSNFFKFDIHRSYEPYTDNLKYMWGLMNRMGLVFTYSEIKERAK